MYKGCFLFDLILYVPVNIFSVMLGCVFLGWTSTKQGLMCLSQGHNAVMSVRLKCATLQSRDKHSTTEPLRSQYTKAKYSFHINCYWFTRVKSSIFRHQVNSDTHLQTVEIQMRRLLMSRLIRIFTVCLVNLFFIPIIKLGNNQGGCRNLAVCPNIPDFTLVLTCFNICWLFSVSAAFSLLSATESCGDRSILRKNGSRIL